MAEAAGAYQGCRPGAGAERRRGDAAMISRRFPDFGKELRRPFEVHGACYDCCRLYDGCEAWPASRSFTCGEYSRLPDVMPGTCGAGARGRRPARGRREAKPTRRGSAERNRRGTPQRVGPAVGRDRRSQSRDAGPAARGPTVAGRTTARL